MSDAFAIHCAPEFRCAIRFVPVSNRACDSPPRQSPAQPVKRPGLSGDKAIVGAGALAHNAAASPRESPFINAYPHLFLPLQAGRLTLKNRIVMDSMHTRLESVPDGSARAAAFYAERAEEIDALRAMEQGMKLAYAL